MAKPSTRDQLIDHCLRRLGAPVIEINVEDDQVEDRIDEAVQYFAQYHYDGSERMYLKYQVTQDDIDRARANETLSTVTDAISFARNPAPNDKTTANLFLSA